jgi:hypothetical protein
MAVAEGVVGREELEGREEEVLVLEGVIMMRTATHSNAWCPFLDRILHSRMPSVPTPARLKR